ncbi:MAG: CapA family protein [Clostridia bacterium]|nr:CapA family protein [Clostridia bacterium]
MAKIIIGADVVPTDVNRQHFIDGTMQNVVSEEILKILNDADFVAMNLEVPLTDVEDKIKKSGPNLIAPTNTIKGYKQLNIDLVTSANNHILDQNKSGLESTLKVLKENGIDNVGSGFTYEQASQVKYYTIGDKKVGFYATCQHEFSWIQDYGFGANGYDPLEVFDHIEKAKKECDYLIVLYHAGIEHFRYVAPFERKVCRKMVDKGANLVVLQHSHCVNCEEDSNGGKIIYGQGNFIFEKRNDECWKTALLVTVDTDNYEIGYVPLDKHNGIIEVDKTGEVLNGYFSRTEEIKDDKIVEDMYYDWGRQHIAYFTNTVIGSRSNKWIRYILNNINPRLGNKLLLQDDSSRMFLVNYFSNPAHSELMLNVLNKYPFKDAEWIAKQPDDVLI